MTSTKLLRTIVLISAALVANATAQQFPRLQEESLAGQPVALPDAAFGKVTVLIMGFTRASQTPTGAWAKLIESDFTKTAGFELYQMPVLEAVPHMFRGMIISGIKKGVPENQQAHFVPVLHKEDELKKLVGYKEEDDAYIVVLDRSGKVVYQTHSSTPNQGYTQFLANLEALLK